MILACVGLYLVHLGFIYRYAVDVPYWDEWALFAQPEFTWSWAVAQTNEHRIVLTRLSIWAMYYLDGWNLRTNQLGNFVLYGVLLVSLVRFGRRVSPSTPGWVTAAFLIFLLTPINWYNHTFGLQSSFHFAMLFLVLAAYHLFDTDQRPASVLAGAACTVLAIASWFGGLVGAVVLVVVFTAFTLARGARARDTSQLAVLLTAAGLAVALYFIGYQSVAGHPPMTWPDTGLFWAFFVNVVSWGFGFETVSTWLGTFTALVVLAPMVIEAWMRRGRLPAAGWALYGLTLGILAIIGAITAGRAGFTVGGPKAYRFSDVTLMLVPLTVFAWGRLLRDRPALQHGVVLGLWLFCAIGFSYKWSWFPIYRMEAQRREAGLTCLREYYTYGGAGDCPTLYPFPAAYLFGRAKDANLSFYRRLMKESHYQ